ncbi:hypothetical protein BGZ93_006986 [Podila epicladia]|nr:hypothetical protein BGZ92_004007 [Podila epicladia]KAG0094627.1 hypothetical protein BGZ93_006986 [Podila epicladia]
MLPSIHIHQTSVHAILVIQITDIDPASVSTSLAPQFDAVELSFQAAKGASAKWTVRPQPAATIQQCSFSVSAENIVFTFTKAERTEWQALDIDGQGTPSHSIVKFVTMDNTSALQQTIRESDLWASRSTVGSNARVTNVQARKVPGANAIEMTANLSLSDS